MLPSSFYKNIEKIILTCINLRNNKKQIYISVWNGNEPSLYIYLEATKLNLWWWINILQRRHWDGSMGGGTSCQVLTIQLQSQEEWGKTTDYSTFSSDLHMCRHMH